MPKTKKRAPQEAEPLARAHVEDQLFCGDAAEVLKTFACGVVDCVVTSPPYFRRRDYGHPGQIGQERSLDQYVDALLVVAREFQRVLSDRGTLWLNLGDSYVKGELRGVPWRVALALADAGWQLRADIIWHKTNAMPHPVKTRPTPDHEYLFLFSKRANYFYDADAIREPHVTFSEHSKMRGGRKHFFKKGGTPEAGKNSGNPNLHDGRWNQAFHPKGRNKRTVWSVSLGKFREAHFAVFPEKLIEPAILAGCPKGGVVLDPFVGSGTVPLVAARLDRRFVGVDLNPDYVAMARGRLAARSSPETS